MGLAPLSLVGKLLHGLLVCAGDTTLLGGQSEVDYGELCGKNSFSRSYGIGHKKVPIKNDCAN